MTKEEIGKARLLSPWDQLTGQVKHGLERLGHDILIVAPDQKSDLRARRETKKRLKCINEETPGAATPRESGN